MAETLDLDTLRARFTAGLYATPLAQLGLDLLDETVRLRRWKAEAVEVMFGLQDLGRALGIGPGQRITGEGAAEVAIALRAELERYQCWHAEVRGECAALRAENASLRTALGMDDTAVGFTAEELDALERAAEPVRRLEDHERDRKDGWIG